MSRPFVACLVALAGLAALPAHAQDLKTGAAAFGGWSDDAPGVRRLIRPGDLSAPYATPSTPKQSQVVERPTGAELKVPAGFKVRLFASGLQGARQMRVAPNGDIFVAESTGGQVRVIRSAPGVDQPSETEVFATGLQQPFGIAFYPLGPNPEWVYVANTTSIVRFPYRAGDLKARGPAEPVVPHLAAFPGGHWAKDIIFSADGTKLFASLGSVDNAGETLPKWTPAQIAAWEKDHGVGAAWGDNAGRAMVMVADPDGKNLRTYATGLRNCEGMAIEPQTHDLYCSVNERDMLGDDLAPDYVTRVKAGGFYGWPWYYIGANEDPRRKGERPDLAGEVIVPDVLIQPHSATLTTTFYDVKNGAAAFPAEYQGDAFAALHGSWNRSQITGFKVIRIRMKDGVPTGEYDDFLTGFALNNGDVWGRPTGVTVARDGAVLVSEDGGNTIWRVSPDTVGH